MRRYARTTGVAITLLIALGWIAWPAADPTYINPSAPAEIPARPPIAPEVLQVLKQHRGYPLAPGYRWVYVGLHESGYSSKSVASKNGPGTTRLQQCWDGSFFWFDDLQVANVNGSLTIVDGDQIDPAPESRVLVPAELRTGLTWKFRNSAEDRKWIDFNATVVGNERVQVPAGVFDAWRIFYQPVEANSEEILAWFVPEVGFVRFDQRLTLEDEGGHLECVKVEKRLLSRIEKERGPQSGYEQFEGGPIAELPSHVRAPVGQISLYADYEDILFGGVVLYVVNNTGDSVHVYRDIEQEYLDETGCWLRCEAYIHRGLSCGFDDSELPPYSFRCEIGTRPSAGLPAKIRYRLRHPISTVSNVGVGLVDPALALLAKYDRRAVRPADEVAIQSINSTLSLLGLNRYSLSYPKRDPDIIANYLTLPKGKEVAILQRALEVGNQGNCLFAILNGLREKNPAQFAEAIKAELRSPSQAKRLRLFNEYCWMDVVDLEIVDIVKSQIGDELDETTAQAIATLHVLPNGADALREVGADSRLSHDIRIYAQLLLKIRSGGGLLSGVWNAESIENRNTQFYVSIRNNGKTAVEIRPEQQPELFVVARQKSLLHDEPYFLAPRTGTGNVRASSQRTNSTTPLISPGDTLQLEFDLADHFEVAGRRGIFQVAINLPGDSVDVQLSQHSASYFFDDQSPEQTEPKKDIFEKAMELEKQGR